MALFKMRTWKDRKSEYPTRRELTREDGTTELVTVARSEGQISQEGDAFSAPNMNDLESRISKAIGTGDIPTELGEDIISAINSLNTGTTVLESGTVITNIVPTSVNTKVNSLVLPAGIWLITSHAAFATSASGKICGHCLMIGQREAVTVRNNMIYGGGSAIPYLCHITEPTEASVIIVQENPAPMTLDSNILRAIKVG